MTIESTKIPASMSGSRLKVLCALADAEEQGVSLTLGDLAKVAGISTAAITGVMDSMTRDGLAQRLRAADDRRKQIVELTRQAKTPGSASTYPATITTAARRAHGACGPPRPPTPRCARRCRGR